MGQVHAYTDWALPGFCAQAWFRCASTGERTDVQAQERGHQHLPPGPRDCEPAGGRQSWESAPSHDPHQCEDRCASRRGAEIVRSTIHRFAVVSFENQVAFGVQFCVSLEQHFERLPWFCPRRMDKYLGWCLRPLLAWRFAGL